MLRMVMMSAMLIAPLAEGRAAPAFSCQVQGSAWSITGTASRKMICQFTCAMKGQGDLADHVACSAAVGPGMSDTPCEGFLSQRRWTSAELVAETCAQQP